MNTYESLLSNFSKLDEHDFQKYLEENTEYIPVPFILNHGVHFNVIISKFPISTSYISDFVYITKSTVAWNIVFIELEKPSKKIFVENKKDVLFSSMFNNACDQVLSWQSYIKKNPNEIKNALKTLLQPIQMRENDIEFKFVLVIGRNNELRTDTRKSMFHNKMNNEFKILTYDSLLNHQNLSHHKSTKHIILSKEKDHFVIKNLDSFNTSIFAYLNSDELVLNKEQIGILRENDFDIDEWAEGELLVYNERHTKNKFKLHLK